MRKSRIFCFLAILFLATTAAGDLAPKPFLWEWIFDVCHHPIGVCSGAPPPAGR